MPSALKNIVRAIRHMLKGLRLTPFFRMVAILLWSSGGRFLMESISTIRASTSR